MADHIVKFRDSLGAADSFIHAMKALIEKSFDGGNDKMEDYCALHLLANKLKDEIANAQRLVDILEAQR